MKDDLNPQDICALLWSLVQLKTRGRGGERGVGGGNDKQLVAALSARAVDCATLFNPADIAMTVRLPTPSRPSSCPLESDAAVGMAQLWALLALDFDPDTRLLDSISAQIRHASPAFSPQVRAPPPRSFCFFLLLVLAAAACTLALTRTARGAELDDGAVEHRARGVGHG